MIDVHSVKTTSVSVLFRLIGVLFSVILVNLVKPWIQNGIVALKEGAVYVKYMIK